MGIVAPGYHLVDVRNEDVLAYDASGRARLHGNSDATVSFIRLQPGQEIPPFVRDDAEDAALVLSGALTYPCGLSHQLTVPAGQWVVAIAGDRHGYVNRSDRPVTLLVFSPAGAQPPPGRSGTRMLSRVFRPIGEPRPRVLVYESDVSRGELVGLRPGERVAQKGVRYAVAYCLDGRIMALMGRDRLALEAGEGVCLVHKESELVGASGKSTVAVFSTMF